MERKRPVISLVAISLGAVALLLAIAHFWAGPFSPQPKLETTVSEKAVAIRNATIAALKGEEAPVEEVAESKSWDLDKGTRLATAVLAGLAIILAVVGLAFHEPIRAAAGGVILGGAALAFQFAILAIGAIFVAILIAAVLGELGFD
jgi:hypothetical protein